MTRIPSSRAMAAAFGFFGWDARTFDFRLHCEARIPRNRAVPMFPAPMTPIFLAGISPVYFCRLSDRRRRPPDRIGPHRQRGRATSISSCAAMNASMSVCSELALGPDA